MLSARVVVVAAAVAAAVAGVLGKAGGGGKAGWGKKFACGGAGEFVRDQVGFMMGMPLSLPWHATAPDWHWSPCAIRTLGSA